MNLDDFFKKYNVGKLDDPAFRKKQEDMLDAMLQRLNINITDMNNINEKILSKLALIIKFEEFVNKTGMFCLLCGIPMHEAFEVMRAFLDMQELRVQEAKKQMDK